MNKKVTFDLSHNQIFFYDKYIIKHNYKTKRNILFYILYKNINDHKWYKYLPYPNKKALNINILINEYNIQILYKVNKWNKITLYIVNDIQNPNFLNTLKWAGIVYLIYLAYDLYKIQPKNLTSNNVIKKSLFSFFSY